MNLKHVFVALVCAVMGPATDGFAQSPQLQVKHQGPCRDPWINYAYAEKVGRSPVGAKNPQGTHAKQDLGECNCNLYAGCAWVSYSQLEQGVVSWNNYTREAHVVARNSGGVFRLVRLTDNATVGTVIRNTAGQLYDFMGVPLGGHVLLSSNTKDLGNGTKIELRAP